jgi:hypothetical protein
MRAQIDAARNASQGTNMDRPLSNRHFETKQYPTPLALCDARLRASRAEEAY